jgi:DeoR/GlpR family transcriptional regulator of sugar metabolism
MAAICRQAYGIFDSSKVERFGTHPFLPVERITALISDTGVPAAYRQEWVDAGVTWDLVDPDQIRTEGRRA